MQLIVKFQQQIIIASGLVDKSSNMDVLWPCSSVIDNVNI